MQLNIPKPIAASNAAETDYIVGDVVVYTNRLLTDRLHVIDVLHEDGSIGITGFYKRESWLCGWAHIEDIHHATAAEITARRRLPESLDNYEESEVVAV